MTPAVIAAASAMHSAVSAPQSPPDHTSLAEEICNNACRAGLWENRELTTYEFRYDARRCDYKELLAQKYRSEIETYLPHFIKTHGPQRANDLSTLPRFIKECATCYSYLVALRVGNHIARAFDNDTDKLWAKRMEIEGIQADIEELQSELEEAENDERRLTRELEAAEKAEQQKGAE